ncbi:MAG: hypothetical protein FJ137_02490, partial [Deltaproteobacteria bacterium]|nr:hypothetical protein [Deltaproteobacteria bacterium]
MGDDKVGPWMGWSLGAVADAQKRPLHELVDYPCTFRFKAVARVDGQVVVDLIARVAAVLGHP